MALEEGDRESKALVGKKHSSAQMAKKGAASVA